MDRVTPVMTTMTMMGSLTVGTTAAWCPTQARQTQIVRPGVGPVVGMGHAEPLGQVWEWAWWGQCRV